MIDDLVIKDGSFFTQEQYSNGEKKAVVMGSGNVNQPTSAPEYTNSVTAFGQSYDVIGTINPANSSYFFLQYLCSVQLSPRRYNYERRGLSCTQQ